MYTGKGIHQTLNSLRHLHRELSLHAADVNHQEINQTFSDYAHQIGQMEQYLKTWIEQKEIDLYIQSELQYNTILVQNISGQ